MTATPKWELRSRYQPNKVVSSTSKAGVMTVHEQKVEQLTTLAASLGFVCMPNTFYRQQFLHQDMRRPSACSKKVSSAHRRGCALRGGCRAVGSVSGRAALLCGVRLASRFDPDNSKQGVEESNPHMHTLNFFKPKVCSSTPAFSL